MVSFTNVKLKNQKSCKGFKKVKLKCADLFPEF